jgi:TolB-like protein/Tfp pilus assembly protein PilF
MNFFAELKRRNVYKVAIAYAVVGWLVIQIGSTVLPTFHAPEWVAQTLVVLVALAFPIALVLAWAFEITPEGVKRAEEVLPNEHISQKSGRKFVLLIAILAIAAAALFAFQVTRSKRAGKAAPKTFAPVEASAPKAIPAKSIAVLPFDNLSRDPDNAFFAEGVQDEILTRLAKVADLKVISRTSTQHFKSAPENLPQIAQQLGVANILEGSVQKADDQVRVNVQLIKAASDAHLWADTYDRKLTNLFSVESDIAKTIADALQAELTGSEKKLMATAPTENSEAYELYLKGRFFWNKRTGQDLRKAIEYFGQAIAKDPGYALAYVGLSDSYLLLSNYGAAAPRDSVPQAKAAVKKALELDANLSEAHASFGLLSGNEFEFERATTEFERAIQLSPNYAMAHHWFGDGPLMALGYSDRSIAEGKRAVELDPLSLICNADLGWEYINARRYDEAIAQLHKTIEMDSHFYLAHYYLGEAFLLKGQLTQATAEYRIAVDLNDDPIALALLGQAYARDGQREAAHKVLARLTEEAKTRYVGGYSFALVLTGLGDKEAAIDALERAYSNGEGADISIIKVDPLLDDLRGQPRFDALLQKIVRRKQ